MAHEADLRAEVDEERALALLGENGLSALDAKHRALLEYVDKVTLRPGDCRREDLDHLRSQGATDEEIHNCVQVAAYFNYINRIADGLGVDLEPSMRDGAPSHLV